METAVATVVTGGPVAGGALIGINSCWTPERMYEQFTQEPSLLGRQFLPAFTQVHPLQEPILLHLQHGMRIAGDYCILAGIWYV